MRIQSMQKPEPFSTNWLEQKWDQLAEWSEAILLEEIEKMGDKTPVLLTYLTEAGEGSLSEDAQELMLFLGVFVAEIFQRVYPEGIPDLDTAKLEATQAANEELLALNEDAPEAFERSVGLLLEFHGQHVLLEFLGEILMDEESTEELPEEMLWEIWIYLKIMIESMDR